LGLLGGKKIIFAAGDPIDFFDGRISVEGIRLFPCCKAFSNESDCYGGAECSRLQAGEFVGCDFHFHFLFSVSVSVFVSLAVPRLLGEEIRIPRKDVNKKVKKIFSPHQTIFLYTHGKSAEPHKC
jgi:hypothetical protein